MANTPSVHDNFVYAYVVDCDGRRIVLHTEFRDREPREFTDVVFRDVVAHSFEHVLRDNILMDVAEVDAGALVRANGRLFEESWRWGWPPVEYGGNLDVLISALKAKSVRAYEVQGSYGMSGWVLAERCERVARSEAARV